MIYFYAILTAITSPTNRNDKYNAVQQVTEDPSCEACFDLKLDYFLSFKKVQNQFFLILSQVTFFTNLYVSIGISPGQIQSVLQLLAVYLSQ